MLTSPFLSPHQPHFVLSPFLLSSPQCSILCHLYLTLLAAAVPPDPLCHICPSSLSLPQLSVSPSAYDNSTSEALSSNHSESFSSSNCAQPISFHHSGQAAAHSSPVATRQVSVEGELGTQFSLQYEPWMEMLQTSFWRINSEHKQTKQMVANRMV